MKNARKWRRLLAVILVMAMVFQSNSISALAAEPETQEEVVNENNNEKKEAVKNEEPKKEETPKEESPPQEPIKEEPKKEEPQKEETKEDVKKEETGKEEAVKEESSKTQEIAEDKKSESEDKKSDASTEDTNEKKTSEVKENTSENEEVVETEKADTSEEEKEAKDEKEEKEEREEPKTSFSFSNSRVSVKATADKKANFPQDTKLKAEYVKPGSAAYNNAASLAESKYASEGKELEFEFYDIYFESDGKRIEPEEGNVTVTVTFNNAVLPDTEDTQSSKHEVIHISGSSVEKVTDKVSTNSKGAATAMKFTSDSFSVFGDMKISTLEAEPVEHDMSDMLTSVSMKIKIGDTWYELSEIPSGIKVPQDAQVEVTLAYNPGDTYLNVNDTITYQLPDIIKPAKEENGKVTDGPEEPGIYNISTNGKITITLTNEEYLENYDHHLQNGKITFKGQFQKNAITEGGKQTIDFGKVDLEVDFEPDPIVTKAVIRVDKNDSSGGKDDTVLYDSAKNQYYIRYNIVVTTPSDNTETIPDVTVEDIVDSGSTSYITAFEVENGNKDEETGKYILSDNTTWDPSTKIWTIGDVSSGGHRYTLTLRAYLSDSALPVYGTTTVKNWAYVKSDGNRKHSDWEETSLNNSLKITKENSGYNKADGTVTYTVTVTAPKSNRKDITDVTVEDIFVDNKEYVYSYDSNITFPSGTEVSADKDKKQLNWNIGTMAPGDVKTLTYTVNIKDTVFLGNSGEGVDRTIKNVAYLYVDKVKKKQDDSNVNFKKQWINKDGELQEDGRVKFTVVANTTEYGSPILNKDFTITDTLDGSDWVYDEESGIAVSWYQLDSSGNKINVGSCNVSLNANQKTWTWGKGSARFPGPNYCFEFVYYAKLKADADAIGSPGISNTAGIKIGVGESTYNHSSSWEGNGNDYGGLEKQFDSKEDNIATWTSEINHTVFDGTKYLDYYQAEDGFSDWEITSDQIDGVEVYKIADDGTNEVLEKDTDYTIAATDEPKGFEVIFKDSTGDGIEASASDPIYITYQTTLNTEGMDPGAERKYRNRAKLIIGNWTKEDYADCNYLEEQKILKSAEGYNATTKEMTWDIKVNITGTLSGNKTVKDTLPEGLVYVSSSVTTGDDAKVSSAEVTCTDNKNITIALTDLQNTGNKNAWVNIRLITKVVDEKFLVSNGEKTFENKAELLDGATKLDESTASQKIENKGLTKGGEYSAPNMKYTITVNSDGHDMLDGVDKITIVDTMGTGLMLKQNTLKAVDKDGNNVTITDLEIKSVTDDEGQEHTEFSFKVPDDRKVIITYEAYVMGSVGSSTTVTNSVKYYGEISTPGVEDKENVIIQESSASIEGTPTLFIKKYDGTDPELKRPLQGATYELYEVTIEDGKIKTTLKDTQTSDASGKVVFTQLSKEKVYAFKEISTADNYYIDDQNKNFTYIAYDADVVPDKIKNQTNIVSTSFTFNRINYKGKIEVTKAFKDNKLSDGVYYFGLFDKNKNIVTINGEKQIKSVEVVNKAFKGNEDSVTFKNLDPGTYYVYETTADGNILEKNSDGSVVINNKKFKVTGEGTAIVVSTNNPNQETTITNEEIPLQVQLTATKKLINESSSNVKVSDFEFGIYQVDQDENESLVEKVSSNESGNIAFSTLQFTGDDAGKTYNYVVKEITEGSEKAENITYDTQEYPVAISISDKLMITVKSGNTDLAGSNDVYTLPTKTEGGLTATFINKYDAFASVTFEGTKYLKNANYDLAADAYSFKIAGPNPATGENQTLVAENSADGKINYPKLTWRLKDLKDPTKNVENIYNYTITETNAGKTIEGVQYSDQTYNVVVTVINTGSGLTASYKVGDETSKSLDFTNTYSAEAEVKISGTKTLDGAELKEGMFRFAITEIPPDGEIDHKIFEDTVQNDENGNFEFTLPKYTQADDGKTFTYEISEVDDKEDGFTYSDEKYLVTIIVTDDKKGKLIIEESITKDGKGVNEITFANTFRGSAELTKIDDADGIDAENPKVLAGAEFELHKVTDDGDVKIGEILTTGEDGKIKAAELVEGDYYFVETKAPEGYRIVRDENGEPVKYKFSIGPNDQTSRIVANAEITVGNTRTKVYIRKVNADGELLKGAKMAVIDPETKQIVEQWTTDGTVKEVTGKLISGKTYYLAELEAPSGYLISQDVEFTVSETDTVTYVTMTDPKDEGKEKLGSISVVKKIVSRELDADYDLYANDAIYYIGLFTDAEGNHPYGQDAIREAHIVNGSSSEPVVYENLPTGTYYVFETTRDGTPIPMNTEVKDGKNSFVCEVTGGGSNSVEINTESEKLEGKVNLTNAYFEFPDGFFYDAFIDITKEVLENGQVRDTDEIFYAGIFSGETEESPIAVTALENNGKVTVEVPLGGENGDQPVTYYVFETDSEGNKIDKEGFAYLVSGEGAVAVDKDNLNGQITITNNLISQVELEVLKVDEDDNALAGAKFTLSSEDGNTTLKSWTSGEEAEEFVLAPGVYKLTEVAAPTGYIKGDDVTITISKDGTISIDGDDAELDGSTVKYMNEKDDSGKSEDDNNKKINESKSVKTGDTTSIFLYMLLMLLAAGVLTVVVSCRRKKNR